MGLNASRELATILTFSNLTRFSNVGVLNCCKVTTCFTEREKEEERERESSTYYVNGYLLVPDTLPNINVAFGKNIVL